MSLVFTSVGNVSSHNGFNVSTELVDNDTRILFHMSNRSNVRVYATKAGNDEMYLHSQSSDDGLLTPIQKCQAIYDVILGFPNMPANDAGMLIWYYHYRDDGWTWHQIITTIIQVVNDYDGSGSDVDDEAYAIAADSIDQWQAAGSDESFLDVTQSPSYVDITIGQLDNEAGQYNFRLLDVDTEQEATGTFIVAENNSGGTSGGGTGGTSGGGTGPLYFNPNTTNASEELSDVTVTTSFNSDNTQVIIDYETTYNNGTSHSSGNKQYNADFSTFQQNSPMSISFGIDFGSHTGNEIFSVLNYEIIDDNGNVVYTSYGNGTGGSTGGTGGTGGSTGTGSCDCSSEISSIANATIALTSTLNNTNSTLDSINSTLNNTNAAIDNLNATQNIINDTLSAMQIIMNDYYTLARDVGIRIKPSEGNLSPAQQRAVAINALNNANQIDNLKNEINNPTPLPGDPT